MHGHAQVDVSEHIEELLDLVVIELTKPTLRRSVQS
jgi:hypothetical protein